jgi:hypothetical protein
MSEREAVAGLNRLDEARAYSMSDEGGSSAATIDRPQDDACERWAGLATALVCVAGFAIGAAIVRLARRAR